MTDEWGPWIEHDGNGCKVPVGTIVHVFYADGVEFIGVRRDEFFIDNSGCAYNGPRYTSSWDWSEPGLLVPIIRYRIRKPRGMTALQEIVASPERELEGVE